VSYRLFKEESFLSYTGGIDVTAGIALSEAGSLGDSCLDKGLLPGLEECVLEY